VIIESFAEASKSSRKFPINAGLPQNVENEQHTISIAILALLIENTLINSEYYAVVCTKISATMANPRKRVQTRQHFDSSNA
jgi:hypothetical protein